MVVWLGSGWFGGHKAPQNSAVGLFPVGECGSLAQLGLHLLATQHIRGKCWVNENAVNPTYKTLLRIIHLHKIAGSRAGVVVQPTFCQPGTAIIPIAATPAITFIALPCQGLFITKTTTF